MTILTENQIQEIQVKYRPTLTNAPSISTAEDVIEVLRQIWNDDSICHFEEFKVIYLNRSNTVLGARTISIGAISGTMVDVRIIMQVALLSNASSIILAHNHPSGSLNPSNADIAVTKKIKEAAKVFDIQVLDHVIITDTDFFSFANEGLI